MRISRRNLLRELGATAVVGTTAPSLVGVSFTEGRQPTRYPAPQQRPILLNHNENAYGPSERVLAALRDDLSLSNRYPRTEYDFLIDKIAALHGVQPGQIAVGCGSSEILRLAVKQFLAPGKKLIQAAPTCSLIGQFARSIGAEVVDVTLTKTHEHNLDAMLARADKSTGLVYICNPNNPTGTLTPRKNIATFLRMLPSGTMVLVDEAYHHFVVSNRNYGSLVDETLQDPRVLVTRTFSAIYGLAGMRVGYVVAAPEIAGRFAAESLHLGISTISVRAATAALDDFDYVLLSAKRNADDLQDFMNEVNGRFLHAIDSHTNFVLLDPMRPADLTVKHLANNNILVGQVIPEMPKYFRVSLGTPAEMKEFWRVLDLMPGSGMMVM